LPGPVGVHGVQYRLKVPSYASIVNPKTGLEAKGFKAQQALAGAGGSFWKIFSKRA